MSMPRIRVRVSLAWLWPAFGVGVFLEPSVLRSGDEGTEQGVDLDVYLLVVSVHVSVYRVLPPRAARRAWEAA